MNELAAFGIDFVVTLVIGVLLVLYLRPSLHSILVDLCAGQERAHFWTVFSTMVLIAVPMISALGYVPGGEGIDHGFFNITHQLAQNLVSFILALIAMGFVVGFFALVAPRTPKEQRS